MLENYLRPLVENNHDIWFQQDGTTAQTANAIMVMLKELFDDRIISKKSNFAWPPRSPDLSAADFFLWGYLKGRVYINKRQTIQSLKESIRQEIKNLQPKTLRVFMENVLKRTIICQQEKGGYLKDVIFKT